MEISTLKHLQRYMNKFELEYRKFGLKPHRKQSTLHLSSQLNKSLKP